MTGKSQDKVPLGSRSIWKESCQTSSLYKGTQANPFEPKSSRKTPNEFSEPFKSHMTLTWVQSIVFPWFFHHSCSHLKQSEASHKPGLEMPDMWPKYPRSTYDIKTIKGKRDNATDVTASCHRQRGWCALTVIASTHQRLNPVTGDSQQTVTSD